MTRELKYRRIERRLEQLIRLGTLRPGDRLPSVRELCRTEKVSPASAMQALMNLEARHLIRARPRSGYYVEPRNIAPPPRTPALATEPVDAGISDQVVQLLRDSANRDLVPLGSALPDPLFLPEQLLLKSMVRATRLNPGATTQYDLAGADLPLRQEIARRLSREGGEVGPEEVVLTNGCTQALNLAIRAVVAPGDLVAIETPCFLGLPEILKTCGARILPIPASPKDGISVDVFEAALRRFEVKALIVSPNFANPTGGLLPDAERDRLARLVHERGVPVIEDDTYRDLAFEGPVPAPLKAGAHRDQTLLCGTFSKTLCPGWRVGWAIPGRYAERVKRLKTASCMATPLLPALACADFLRSGHYDRHLRALRSTIATQICRLEDAVARDFPASTAVARPHGGFYTWIELPGGIDATELAVAARNCGIGIAPGELFSAGPGLRSFVRLNAARRWTPEIDRAVKTLGALARRQLEASVRPLEVALT